MRLNETFLPNPFTSPQRKKSWRRFVKNSEQTYQVIKDRLMPRNLPLGNGNLMKEYRLKVEIAQLELSDLGREVHAKA